jgi:two-component system, NtrC family, C4-dicarboxylate transport sensor histidine kinase DctB
MRAFSLSSLRLAGIGVSVAGALLLLSYLLSMRWGLEALEEEAERRATSVTAALFAPIQRYSYLPAVVATHSLTLAALNEPDNPRSTHAASTFLSGLNNAAGTEVVYVIDINGNTIASSNWAEPNSFVGHNFSFRPYFQEAMRGKDGHFYAMGVVSLSPGYYVSHPVMVDHRILGVVAIKINLSNLDHEWRVSHDYEVTVADELGINFLSSRADWKYRPLQPLDAAQVQHLTKTRQYDAILQRPLRLEEHTVFGSRVHVIKTNRADGAGRPGDNAGYVLQQQKLREAPWTVSVFMPVAPVRDRAIRHTAIVAALLAFLSIAGLYWREQRRRIADREQSRREIEAAHTELAERHRQLEKLSEELYRNAVTDPLLPCYNRRFFLEHVGKLAAGMKRHGTPLSIVILDVDHFKHINDSYGHPTGDMVLQRVAEICGGTMRGEDIFARFGGEEFILALVHTTEEEATVAAERLRMAVADEMFEHEGREFKITISCGLAQYDAREPNIEDAIRRADKALYAAKQAGRNRVAAARHLPDEAAEKPALLETGSSTSTG